MGRFATREDEVDELFRLGVFVDLYRVVRQGLQAGVESYSIKRLEPLCGYSRVVGLRDATAALISFEAASGGWVGARGCRRGSEVIAGYNEDDCRATLALRDWLESLRPELAAQLGVGLAELPRPVVAEPEPDARGFGGNAASRGLDVVGARAAVVADSRAGGIGAARRPAGVAPPGEQACVVALLLRPDAVVGGSGRPSRTRSACCPAARSSARSRSRCCGSSRSRRRSTSSGRWLRPHDPITGRGFEVDSVDDARGEIVLKVGQRLRRSAAVGAGPRRPARHQAPGRADARSRRSGPGRRSRRPRRRDCAAAAPTARRRFRGNVAAPQPRRVGAGRGRPARPVARRTPTCRSRGRQGPARPTPAPSRSWP